MSDILIIKNLNLYFEFIKSWENDKILPTNEEITEIIKNEKYVAFRKIYDEKEKMNISTKKTINEYYKINIDKVFLIIFAFIRDDTEIRHKINKSIVNFTIDNFILNIYFINNIIYDKYSNIN